MDVRAGEVAGPDAADRVAGVRYVPRIDQRNLKIQEVQKRVGLRSKRPIRP